MAQRIPWIILLRLPGLSGLSALLITVPAWAEAPDAAKLSSGAPQDWFIYTIIILLLAGSLLALLFIRAALGESTWSIADALSEEAEVSGLVRHPDGTTEPKLDGSGKPVTVTEMRASSSRLIALMGMVGILMMFLGFGAFALFSFGRTGTMPAGNWEVIKYLLAGMTLFAPYVVNKFASVFESLSPKR